MTALWQILRSRWVRTLAGALLLAVIIWMFGPLLAIGPVHPLDSETIRIAAVAAILVLWLVENLVHVWRARKKEQALVEDVAAAGPDPNVTATAEEVATLAARLKEALGALKRAKLGGRRYGYLYQLPWYMFIGPPGAGKTTALVNCGLHFPLADTHGPEAVRGVGGTRDCDWWFTDQAVLIDTAGRYTTQDSNKVVDGGAWLGFLKLLKHHRRRQPLNGVLVTISVAEIAALGEEERLGHAKAIRRRIRELHDELGVRIPAYVLFTKADLLTGFIEFFENLGKEEREQVWGMTFPLDDGRDENGTVAQFGAEFDLLLGRLNERMLERVQQETDIERRRLIHGFPQQLASVRGTALEFLTEIFRPSRLEARPLLRGVYFTSGTQEGTPIDRLLGAMAGKFGLPRQSVAAPSGAARSYFLSRFMQGVLFGEAGLVSRDPKVERRQFWTRVAALSVAGLTLLVLSGAWAASYFSNLGMIGDVRAAELRFQDAYATLAKRGPQDMQLAPLLPALAVLRTMPGGYEDRAAAPPLLMTMGLYQGGKLSVAAEQAYGRALNTLLLPRLLARLETMMQTHLDQPDYLYTSLKVYLILGRQGPLDRDLVEEWLGADITRSFVGEDKAAQRDALLSHLHALVHYDLVALPLNGLLVAQARGILTRQPLSEYVYNRVLQSAVVQSLPEWTVADNAGPAGGRVFELRDGKPLNSGLPGIFTWEGYHSILLPLLPGVTKDAAEDAWVLGRQSKGGVMGSAAAMAQLRRDVLGLYLDDYGRRWDFMLGNIALKKFTTVPQVLDELYLLSAPESPLRDLLQAINAQTQLSRPAATEVAAGQAEAKAAKVGSKLKGFGAYLTRAGMSVQEAQVAGIFGEVLFGTDAAGKPIDPATRIDEHFHDLNDFVAGGKDKPLQMEAVIGKIQQVYQGLSQAANAPNQGNAMLQLAGNSTGGASASAQLQDVSQGVPKAVGAMLQTVSQSTTQVTSNGASQQLSDAWASKILPTCQDAFNRYPFIADSSEDVPLDDFTRLLGPNGLMDQFFDQNLKALVDTTQKTWRWQAKLGLSDTTLAEFQNARDIRDALFPTGSAQMSVKFDVVPTQLDAGLEKVSLELGGGQRLTFAHGPAETKPMQWPAADGSTLARLTMTPIDANQGAQVTENSGAWALLHLLDAGHAAASSSLDKVRISFSSPAGKAEFQFIAHSVHNPFTMATLRAFRCPAKL